MPETSTHPPVEPLSFPPSGEEYRPYTPEDEAYRYLQSLVPDSLTPSEQNAIHNYAYGEMDKAINSRVESGGSDSTTRKLDSAISKAQLPAPLIVYRGAGPEQVDPDDFQQGKTQMRRYVSVTLDQSLARAWRNSLTVERIELPAGMPVAVANVKEAELLLPHGLTFEDLSATLVDDYTLICRKALLPESSTEEQNVASPPVADLDNFEDPWESSTSRAESGAQVPRLKRIARFVGALTKRERTAQR